MITPRRTPSTKRILYYSNETSSISNIEDFLEMIDNIDGYGPEIFLVNFLTLLNLTKKIILIYISKSLIINFNTAKPKVSDFLIGLPENYW